MSISLVVGLGNPGRLYEQTRHNLGWVVVDALAAKHGLAWKSAPQFKVELARWDHAAGRTLWLAKPQSFMNESGSPVGALARFHKLEPSAVAVVYDDLTIDLGLVKVSVTGSAGGHNGVASLLERFGSGFARYRIGIGPKEPPQMDLADFVLGKFTPDQHILITQKTALYVQGLELLLSHGPAHAMNQLNRRDPS